MFRGQEMTWCGPGQRSSLYNPAQVGGEQVVPGPREPPGGGGHPRPGRVPCHGDGAAGGGGGPAQGQDTTVS